MPDIKAIQNELRANKIDGWLFCDHHHRDPIAEKILELPANGMATRRWFYYIPAKGEPRKLVHRIESRALNSLPGKILMYAGWEELQRLLPKLLAGGTRIAMQYSPQNNIPYIGLVDAGTVELVRRCKKKVVSSADLVQIFEATWTPEQLASHLAAGEIIDCVTAAAFRHAAESVRAGATLTEFDLQQWILDEFARHNIETPEPPIVAIQPNNGNPHYEAKKETAHPIRAGDLLLLDIWGKLKNPGSVYYDITWVAYLGKRVPEAYRRIFAIVREARDGAVDFIQRSITAGRDIRGWEVDKFAREIIRKSGYGKQFLHRTGHSIGQNVHGNGANMDSLETRDDRKIVPHTCFSIEPGIYLPEFGIRSEVNVYVGANAARVTGKVETEMLVLLS